MKVSTEPESVIPTCVSHGGTGQTIVTAAYPVHPNTHRVASVLTTIGPRSFKAESFRRSR
jgi:hypothetical protein